MKIGSNVSDALQLARAAAAHLRASDVREAGRHAYRALVLDPDCVRAAMIIARVAKKDPSYLNREDMFRARLAIARAIMRSSSAIVRLNDRVSDQDVNRARDRVQRRYLPSLRRHWNALQTIPFKDDSSEPCDGNTQDEMLRAVVEATLAPKRDQPAAVQRLSSSPAMATIVDALLRRQKYAKRMNREEITDGLAKHIFVLLLLNGWLPTAVSEREFLDQVVSFLTRRIQWPALLARCDQSEVDYRDEATSKDGTKPHPGRSRRIRRHCEEDER
jgi:hypothetical protein